MISRLSIEDFIAATESGALLIDVRSPGEYAHARIPGARSLPLFSDEERAVVGTAYKQRSREQAIKNGLDFFGPKMRAMVEQVEVWNKQSQHKSQEADCRLPTVDCLLYCWRGGMRSGAVAWLLDLYGFKVTVLQGGYKAYRTWALAQFDKQWPLQVLGGLTGSGKTEVLARKQSGGEAVICLETLAAHKGSAFGSIGMPSQPSQEHFENELALALHRNRNRKPIWIEDESQRIGDRNLPYAFWKALQEAPLHFLELPFETRLDHIVAEYGTAPAERLQWGVERIRKRLGPLDTKLALEHLQKGEIRDAFAILLRYYDRLYTKGLHNRQALSSLITREAI